jgi:hypothetical protein
MGEVLKRGRGRFLGVGLYVAKFADVLHMG